MKTPLLGRGLKNSQSRPGTLEPATRQRMKKLERAGAMRDPQRMQKSLSCSPPPSAAPGWKPRTYNKARARCVQQADSAPARAPRPAAAEERQGKAKDKRKDKKKKKGEKEEERRNPHARKRRSRTAAEAARERRAQLARALSFQQRHSLGGQALTTARKAEPVGSRGPHGQRIRLDRQRCGQLLLHLLAPGCDPRLLADENAVGVDQRPAGAAHLAVGTGEQIRASRRLASARRWKERASRCRQSGRTEQSVDQGVGRSRHRRSARRRPRPCSMANPAKHKRHSAAKACASMRGPP